MSRDNKARLFLKTASQPVELVLNEKELKKRSKELWKFIENHPGLQLKYFCTQVGYDRGNFTRHRDAKKVLSQTWLLRFEDVLSGYGFKNN